MTRQAYVLHDHKLVIFWTQKAACTSLSALIARDIVGASVEDIKSFGGRGPRRYLNKMGFHCNGRKAATISKRTGYHSIALIREPYDRLISAFTNKFLFYKRRALDGLDRLEPFSQRFYLELKKIEDPSDVQNYDGLSFAEFVNEICQKIDDRGDKEPRLDKHFNTQIPFAFVNNGFQYDYFYTLKETNTFISKLSELTGKSLNSVTHNSTNYSNVSSEILCNQSSLEIISKHTSVSKKQFESPELREKVKKSFSPDYFYLGDGKR